jgi:Ca2+-binding RTX toxin-like protein
MSKDPMNIRGFYRLMLFGLLALIIVSMVAAYAAGMVIAPSSVDFISRTVTVDDLKPSACSGITLTNLVSGSGTITGTAANDLILGSSGDDTISGGDGDDCIVGGGGDDSITGSGGTDVCIGGAGADTFFTCETVIDP